MPWLVYILLCDDVSYYVGITNNLHKRLASHKSGYNIGTKEHKLIELVYSEKYQLRRNAEKRERQIKRWTRAKKKALVEGNISLLKKLSKSREFGEGCQ